MLVFKSRTPQELLKEIAEHVRQLANRANSVRGRTVTDRLTADAFVAALTRAATDLEAATIQPAAAPSAIDIPVDAGAIKQRLEYLRGELKAERISYGELVELQGLASHIDPSDVELLEAAGVPEGEAPPAVIPVSPADADRAGEWQIDALIAEAEQETQRLRAAGWGQKDFANALKELLEENPAASPENTFTPVANALAVMVLNHGIRGYLELYDPKAYEQAEAALVGYDPAYAQKIAEARAASPKPTRDAVEDVDPHHSERRAADELPERDFFEGDSPDY